jgi:Zn-dependent protease with chaperone function
MQRLNGVAFGPGFSATGSKVEFDIGDYGLRLVAAEGLDGSPPWAEVAVHKSGWDGSQVRLEWQGKAGRYALMLADAASVAAVRASLPKGVVGIRTSRPDGATRAWSHAMIWFLFVLPVLALVAVIWQHDRIAGWAVSHIPVDQERKLGEMVFAQQKAKLKLVEGKPLELVRDIGARLTRGSAYKYEFYLADDKVVNAYAMPGGFVVMHTGLLQLADTPEEIAGVLAHEVMHVEKRHSLKGMAKSLGLMATFTLVFGDLGGLASIGNDLLGLKFSRDHETEADREGLKALVGAGLGPQGMASFFRKMAAQDKLDLGFLSTHPASEERFAAIDAAIKALPDAARNVPALPVDYQAIKAALPK